MRLFFPGKRTPAFLREQGRTTSHATYVGVTGACSPMACINLAISAAISRDCAGCLCPVGATSGTALSLATELLPDKCHAGYHITASPRQNCSTHRVHPRRRLAADAPSSTNLRWSSPLSSCAWPKSSSLHGWVFRYCRCSTTNAAANFPCWGLPALFHAQLNRCESTRTSTAAASVAPLGRRSPPT